MTRKLILTRHAESDWNDINQPDHDRTLNRYGHRSATAIGQWLLENRHLPATAVLSTARRVIETWAGIAPRLNRDVQVVREEALYLSSPETMLDVLSRQTASCVILIAHNPGMGALGSLLIENTAQSEAFDGFPTCATLVLEFDQADWNLTPQTGRIVDLVVPRDLIG